MSSASLHLVKKNSCLLSRKRCIIILAQSIIWSVILF